MSEEYDFEELEMWGLSADKRNSMAFWWPKIKDLDIPQPKTVMVEVDPKIYFKIMCDENTIPDTDFIKFEEAIQSLGGYPIFCRGSQMSGKHHWKEACYIESKMQLHHNIFQILEAHFLTDKIPDAMFFRQYIPMESYFTAWWGELPVNKEVRCFIKDGVLACQHPYWPISALEQIEKHFIKDKDWRQKYQKLLDITKTDRQIIASHLIKLISVFGNEWWSCDFSKGFDGTWYLIDMAIGSASYHWPGCPNKPRVKMKDGTIRCD